MEDIEAARQEESDLILLEQDSKDHKKLKAFQNHMTERTEQITNVTQSIGKIQEMFGSLNEIVN